MAKFLKLVNGVPRMVEANQSEAYLNIVNAHLNVVNSPSEPNEIAGPIDANTPITLPNSLSYTDTDMNIYMNGVRLIPGIEYNYVGTPPRTQVSFTFQLLVGDRLFFEVF